VLVIFEQREQAAAVPTGSIRLTETLLVDRSFCEAPDLGLGLESLILPGDEIDDASYRIGPVQRGGAFRAASPTTGR
jgi:hypothetical protein